MPNNIEIATDIRNKLQTSCLVIERTEAGEDIPESLIDLAINNLSEAERLLTKLKHS